MKKIILAAVFLSSILLASCTKKANEKSSSFAFYNYIFSAQSTLATAD